MLEKLFGFFRKNNICDRMSDEMYFRMAMFTGAGLENFYGRNFSLTYEGQRYNVELGKDGKALVKKIY